MLAAALSLNQWHISGVDWYSGVLHRLSMSSIPVFSERQRADLIKAIAVEGDRTAFITLFEFYAPRIKAQAMRFGLDSSAAEDVAQDAMLSLWRRAHQFDPTRGSASAWIFTIATNARLDRIRRERPAMPLQSVGEDDPMMAVAADDSGFDAARLGEIVSALPQEQRHIVQLSFYADIPHAEIATRLGIPLGTVKSRIRLAMARLRQALGEKP